MGRKFAVFDIDGTLFRSHLYWEVVLELAKSEKLHPSINKRTLELYNDWKERKSKTAFEDFDKQTIHAIDDLLTELNPDDYDAIVGSVVRSKIDHTYVYTKELLKNLKNQGYFLIAVSGSRIEEVDIFAPYHGFDDWIGQKYHRSDDKKKYTGEAFKTYKDKHLLVEEFVKKNNLTYEGSYGVGDTGGDISMLELVEHPIAFNPNRDLLDVAQQKGWKIVVERKSIAYQLEQKNGSYVLTKAA